MLLGIFIAVILGAIILYLNQNDQQPIPNDGAIGDINFTDRQYRNQPIINPNPIVERQLIKPSANLNQISSPQVDRPLRPPILDNRRANDISGDLVSDIVSQYTFNENPINNLDTTFSASDPMSETHGTFTNYGHKRQLNMRKMEQPYADDLYDDQDYSYKPHRVRNKKGKVDLNLNSDSEPDYFAERSNSNDSRDFTHKKRQFTKRTPDDIADQFDIASMLPQEDEKDWFDTMHSLTAKKIQGTHLLHPKVHMGVNTVNSSLRNGTHDIRGDIPNPKFFVGLWNNSTIEPDTNIKGICSSI
jgi:hypothetical protein